MALLKGRFIDPSEAIKLSSNPTSGEDVARKVYVDTKSSADAAAAQAAAQSYTDQKINDLINASPATLDTLKELADALGEDPNFATTIAGQLSSLDDKIDQEIADRLSAITNEAALREAGDSAEQSAREAADAQETAARQAADSVLDGKITTEKNRAEGEEERIEGKVDAETSAREAADAGLQSQIDALDSGNATSLAEEIAARQAGDANLQSQVDTEKGRIDAILLASEADKDSFAEIVQLINSVDTENDSAFASYVLSNNAALATEQSQREAADQELQFSIGFEQQRAQFAEDRIEGKVDQEVLDRQSAVSTEQSARQTADQGLQSQITQEVSDRQAAVSSEQTAREAADSALDTRLDALEAAPQVQGQKVSFTLSAQDVTNGYIEMQHEPLENTMMVVVSGMVHSEEEDYTLSTTSGVTRISFTGDLASKLQEGDKVKVQFLKHGSSEGEGGGGGGGGGEIAPAITNLTVSSDISAPADVSIAYTGNVSNYYIRQSEGGSWNTVVYEPNHMSGSPITASITRPAAGSGLTSFRVDLNSPEGQSVEQEFTIAEAPSVAAEDLAVSATSEDKANSPYATISGWGVLNIQVISPSSGSKVYLYASFNGGATWNFSNELNALSQHYEPVNAGGTPTLFKAMLVKDIGSGPTPVTNPNVGTVNVTVVEEVQLIVQNF
jgi:hypothetical protein